MRGLGSLYATLILVPVIMGLTIYAVTSVESAASLAKGLAELRVEATQLSSEASPVAGGLVFPEPVDVVVISKGSVKLGLGLRMVKLADGVNAVYVVKSRSLSLGSSEVAVAAAAPVPLEPLRTVNIMSSADPSVYLDPVLFEATGDPVHYRGYIPYKYINTTIEVYYNNVERATFRPIYLWNIAPKLLEKYNINIHNISVVYENGELVTRRYSNEPLRDPGNRSIIAVFAVPNILTEKGGDGYTLYMIADSSRLYKVNETHFVIINIGNKRYYLDPETKANISARVDAFNAPFMHMVLRPRNTGLILVYELRQKWCPDQIQYWMRHSVIVNETSKSELMLVLNLSFASRRVEWCPLLGGPCDCHRPPSVPAVYDSVALMGYTGGLTPVPAPSVRIELMLYKRPG